MADNQITQRTVEALALADAAMKQAEADLATYQAKSASASQLIPGCVDSLVQYGYIQPDQREKAAAALADHSRTIQLLSQLAQTKNAAAPPIGSAVKSASAKQRESDRIWERQFGTAADA